MVVDSLSALSLGFASLLNLLLRSEAFGPARGGDERAPAFPLLMHDLTFSLLEGGLPRQDRMVVLFRFVTPARIVRSGMLNFDRAAGRFVGPQRSPELMQAALDYIRSLDGGREPESRTA